MTPTAADLTLARELVVKALHAMGYWAVPPDEIEHATDHVNDQAAQLVLDALSECRANSAAMRVVEAILKKFSEPDCCHLCIGNEDATLHDEDCPLVENGFIDRDGKRLPAPERTP